MLCPLIDDHSAENVSDASTVLHLACMLPARMYFIPFYAPITPTYVTNILVGGPSRSRDIVL